MRRCRSRFAPRMLAACTACGEQRSVPHSCGHRACPHCQHHEAQVWLQRQLQSLVPATYFMLTFTLPAELRGLAWSHQRVLYALLMQCAWDTLDTFAHNDARLRATPGAVGVLHTHNRRLDFHPHVHMVMPAAALDTRRRLWRTKSRRGKAGANAAGGGYLFNHKALAKVFRGKLRGAIQEAHILRCDDSGNVTFGYRDAKTGAMATRTLPGADFLWLVLQHVLPKGLRRARNFGFLHPNSAGAIRLLQLLHLRAAPAAPPSAARTPRPAWRCACGQPMRVLRRRMPALQPDPTPNAQDARTRRPDKPDAAQVHTMH